MKKNKKGSQKAKELLEEIELDEISDFPLDLFVASLGATLILEPLKNSDGKIIRGNSKTIIKINSEIPYEEKLRFTIAHELGHHLLHSKLDLEAHNDNSHTLNWFKEAENQAKKGIQEWEANDFASELLMPEDVLRKYLIKKRFSPELVQELSNRFKTSITSIVYRLMSLNIYPLFIVSIINGKVQYWSKSEDFWVKVKDIVKLSPPEDSVAKEYIDANYDFIYKEKDKAQSISKSTWFELKPNEDDSDFFEYCIPTKQYKSIVSVIWEE
jgi:Zn-dependent peptidase ImmA (M78 family)